MKIFSKYAYMGAIALVGAVGFTACSSDDDLATQDPVTGEVVKTQFAISIPGATQTRMGQDIVQATGNFRGMTNIRLVPFDLASTPTETSNPLTGTETTRYNTISLGDISSLTANSNSTVYKDIDIPLGTDAFLFYGEALPGTDKTDAVNGALVPSFVATGLPVGTTVDNVSFSLKGILGNQDAKTSQDALTTILNGLAKLENWSTATGDLKTYYDNLLKMKAGSANNILLAIQDLYNAMKSDRVTDESNLKSAICSKIEGSFNVSQSSPYTLTYQNDAIDEFPNDLGLPDGAVQVKWNGDDNTFEYVTSVDYDSDAQNTFNVAALDKYVFPSSLYYWLNTNIKTSTAEQSNNYGTNDWSTIISNYYKEGYEVTTSTQSVALENPINYAVGRLDVYAKFANGDILDNTQDPGPQPVRLPAAGFTLNGVLIGGQKAVNWNFTTNTAAGEYTIYDCKVPSTSAGVTTTDGLKNSTLALETKEAVGDKINFALEFINNSEQAFTGADGIVPVGGKFYLVGTLTSTDANKNVFKQDCITKANVTIQSLKSAYNCIPDLRSPKLELGLSVDLDWKPGLVDNVVIQ